ncbi:hypothetical protein AVEN_235042-1 [Araneus ventricosus]|uniref:Uncharacterized protein n=1 Tax=Araneus ventricosus TaxID=182803 RepID=A0A4Y2VD28_ARAVE|nr:hypothetical protein AVEN_195719-1 [Araneus ventricosus]GBO23165.1 hypothetical protein AVEN_235042-1 [Araneus ventricosus]
MLEDNHLVFVVAVLLLSLRGLPSQDAHDVDASAKHLSFQLLPDGAVSQAKMPPPPSDETQRRLVRALPRVHDPAW